MILRCIWTLAFIIKFDTKDTYIVNINVIIVIIVTCYHNCYAFNIYLFKVYSMNTRKGCEICSKAIIKSPELHQLRCSGNFIVNFEHIPNLFLLSLLFTLNK